MADYVILRPKRKDQVRQEFRIVLRKEIKATQHKKLGLYDPKNGRVEEWCYKEDYEHFSEPQKKRTWLGLIGNNFASGWI